MLLFVSLRILSCKHLVSLYCDYANDLLVKFVKDVEVLYGKEALVYNVHCLVHLAADVKKLGCIQEFSAFPFESKLGHLKKLVHKPQHPIQQILRRLDGQKLHGSPSHSLTAPAVKFEHSNGPLLDGFTNVVQYKRLHTDNFSLTLRKGNNCILTSYYIPATVQNIVAKDSAIYLLCKTFRNVYDSFDYPVMSRALNIFAADLEVDSLIAVKVDDVLCKCVWIPGIHTHLHNTLHTNDNRMASRSHSVVIPLLH